MHIVNAFDLFYSSHFPPLCAANEHKCSSGLKDPFVALTVSITYHSSKNVINRRVSIQMTLVESNWNLMDSFRLIKNKTTNIVGISTCYLLIGWLIKAYDKETAT